jgi:DNA-directed RNA polymerase subunit RPC12/RpoP
MGLRINESYRCSVCGGEFKKGRSDEEADAEAERIFGTEKASEAPGQAIVCDVCFKKLNIEANMRAMRG